MDNLEIGSIIGTFIFLFIGVISYATSYLDANEIMVLCVIPAFVIIWYPIVKIYLNSKKRRSDHGNIEQQ